MQKVCTNCLTVWETKKQTQGSIWIELVLWITFIVPWLIYSIWRMTSKKQVCKWCGSDSLIPVNSPAGQKLINNIWIN